MEACPQVSDRIRGVSPVAAAAARTVTILLAVRRADRPGRWAGSGEESGSCWADMPPSPTERGDGVPVGDRRQAVERRGCHRASGSTIPGPPRVPPRRRERSRALEPPDGTTGQRLRSKPQASRGGPRPVTRSPEPTMAVRVEPAVEHSPATEGEALAPAAFAAVKSVVPPGILRATDAAASTKRAPAWGARSLDREAEWSGPGRAQLHTVRSARSPRSPARCIGDRRSPFVCFLIGPACRHLNTTACGPRRQKREIASVSS
jgi:hypothetical protein